MVILKSFSNYVLFSHFNCRICFRDCFTTQRFIIIKCLHFFSYLPIAAYCLAFISLSFFMLAFTLLFVFILFMVTSESNFNHRLHSYPCTVAVFFLYIPDVFFDSLFFLDIFSYPLSSLCFIPNQGIFVSCNPQFFFSFIVCNHVMI